MIPGEFLKQNILKRSFLFITVHASLQANIGTVVLVLNN
jgi:hypothetical protein